MIILDVFKMKISTQVLVYLGGAKAMGSAAFLNQFSFYKFWL